MFHPPYPISPLFNFPEAAYANLYQSLRYTTPLSRCIGVPLGIINKGPILFEFILSAHNYHDKDHTLYHRDRRRDKDVDFPGYNYSDVHNIPTLPRMRREKTRFRNFFFIYFFFFDR